MDCGHVEFDCDEILKLEKKVSKAVHILSHLMEKNAKALRLN